MSGPTNPDESRWLDNPKNVEWLWRAVCVSCVLLVLADLFYNKHGHYDFEGLIGFHGVFGFIAFVFVVLAGTRMRDFLMRSEDYYDEHPPERSAEHVDNHDGGH